MEDVLDSAAIDQLVHGIGGGDPTILKDVAKMFLDIGPGKVREIRASFDARDGKALAHAAHFLKGSAGTLGVARVRADCHLIEKTDIAEKEEELRELLDDLDAHIEEGVLALKELVAQYD